LAITGLPLGPYPVGVRTVQIDGDPKRGRGLQTEFWYPSTDAALDMDITKFSDYLGLDTCQDPQAALAAANADNAIGGYREGISVEELDDPSRTTWLTNAVRDAPVLDDGSGKKWPLVIFSHGSGAYRASYSFWTEFLASHGFVVAACDHPGSARFTIVDGKILTPIKSRIKKETDRPLDLVQIIDGVQEGSASSDLFAKTDANNVAITGMSFGGFTTAATLELLDPRVKAAVMMCSSMAMSGTQDYHTPVRKNKSTPVMVMMGTEDTVLGEECNDASRQYVNNHSDGDAYLLEIVRGGHVSFTSCEMYDPEYGNGINAEGVSKSLTNPGTTYKPLPIQLQHEIINNYGLHFLNKYLKNTKNSDDDTAYLSKNQYDEKEVVFWSNRKD
jgi:dienelactone hydrolase